MATSYTEDHLFEHPAIQLMQHELGWDVVEGGGILDVECWILNGRGKRQAALRLNPDLLGDKT